MDIFYKFFNIIIKIIQNLRIKVNHNIVITKPMEMRTHILDGEIGI